MPRNEDGLNHISWLMHETQSSFIHGYVRKLGYIFYPKNEFYKIYWDNTKFLLIDSAQSRFYSDDNRKVVSLF